MAGIEITIEFRSGDITKKQVVVSQSSLPLATTEGLFLNHQNLSKGSQYEYSVYCNGRFVAKQAASLPTDWKNLVDAVTTFYGKADKSILGRIPLFGKILEALAPDIHWSYDLWYKFTANESGLLEYNVHFGPSDAIDIRVKTDGLIQL